MHLLFKAFSNFFCFLDLLWYCKVVKQKLSKCLVIYFLTFKGELEGINTDSVALSALVLATVHSGDVADWFEVDVAIRTVYFSLPSTF